MLIDKTANARMILLLGQYKEGGKKLPVSDIAGKIAAELGMNKMTVMKRISSLKIQDPEFFGGIGKEGRQARPLSFTMGELEAAVDKALDEGKKFPSITAMCEHMADGFGVLGATVYVRLKDAPEALKQKADNLVAPYCDKDAAGITFDTGDAKRNLNPQYIAGLLDNGSFWFHNRPDYNVPRPMFTMTSFDRKAVELLKEYFESGEVRFIEPGEYQLRISGFDNCMNLRAFLEEHGPINMARQYEKWKALWDAITSQKIKGGGETDAKVKEITSMARSENVILPEGKLPLEWAVGFIDGAVGRFFDARLEGNRLGARAQLCSNSEPLLNAIRDILGVGLVSKIKGKAKFKYFVNRLDTGLLAHALEKFKPLIKLGRFIIWKEVAEIARTDTMPSGTEMERVKTLVEKLNTDGVVRRKKT